MKILQTLGIDVFKDMWFDSWALQALILRIENNELEDKRDIKAGEEITVSYVGEMPSESEGSLQLRAHIGCVCRCARCHKERKVSLEKAPKDSLEDEALQQHVETLSDN